MNIKGTMKNARVDIILFGAFMVLFTVLSCTAGGEKKAIKTAKSLVFYPKRYESQYQLGDVCENAMRNPEWTAKKVDGDWYVTVKGNLINIDSMHLPQETRQVLSIYKSFGLDIEEMVYSVTFLITDDGGQVAGGSSTYDSDYSEQDAEGASGTVNLLYAIYDGFVKSTEN